MSNRQTVPASQALTGWRKETDDRVLALEQRQPGSPNGLIVPGGQAGAWIALPLAVGWAPQAAGFGVPSYVLDADGFVHLRGVAAKSSAIVNETFATLPAGYRPSLEIVAACWCGSNATQNACRVDVQPNGAVIFSTPSPGGTSGFVSLDSVAPFYAGGQ